MASEHTQNYNLSRWTLADEVRMEDFNSDNEKIDTALSEVSRATTAPLLLHTVVQTAASSVSLNVEELDLTQYQYLYLDLYQTQEQDYFSITLRANGLTSGYTACTGSGSTSASNLGGWTLFSPRYTPMPTRLVIPVHGRAGVRLVVRTEDSANYNYHGTLTVGALKTLDFSASSIPPGVTFDLRGVR